MTEIFYKCTLLSDIVLNSKLATEGNMTTLDHIPGSNFLGIVASELYKDSSESSFELFHSGKVSFGDAHISSNNEIAYPMPLSFFQIKGADIETNKVYLHHLLPSEQLTDGGKRLQLKQIRSGYMTSDGSVIKEIPKNFSLKSAYDRKNRTSEDGKMFGFESLEKGLQFIFSVRFEDDNLIEIVNKSLDGTKRLGKSKNAEYGQVEIRKIQSIDKVESFKNDDFTMVYAQSNLCFTNDFGQPTFQPEVKDLGLEGGIIDWAKSQIRSFSYSPWNAKRNTSNAQRFCIAKGSVFYVENANAKEVTNSIGNWQAEGLGRVIYNPSFLEGKGYESILEFKKAKEGEKAKVQQEPNSVLGKFLVKQLKAKKSELEISRKVTDLVYSDKEGIPNLKKISSSQWGGIRAFATKSQNINELEAQLFTDKTGYLTHGVADEKYWGKNRGVNLKAFEKIFTENKELGTPFIAKFAAEMAKESRKSKENQN
jgi:hypothetical protein